MKERVRIEVGKKEKLPEVAARVFAAQKGELVLVVPKGAEIANPKIAALAFLQEGAKTLSIELSIESVDEKILAHARDLGLKAYNPFFEKEKENGEVAPKMTGMGYRDEEEDEEGVGEPKPDSPTPDSDGEAEEEAEEEEEVGEETEEEEVYAGVARPKTYGERVGDDVFLQAEEGLSRAYAPRETKPGKFPVAAVTKVLLGLIALLGLGIYGTEYFKQATIAITTKKKEITLNEKMIVGVGQAIPGEVPGEIFSKTKNGEFLFSASSKKQVAEKSKGRIYIYNAYSSEAQPLVKNTRFEKDGKIFRLTEAVTVPGAKIVNGKITPSLTEAEVIADKAGAEYNIGPVAKLTIPGFKQFPEKYAGFYGELRNQLAGGFMGEIAYPTDQDMAKAREQVTNAFRQALSLELSKQIPKGYTVLPNAEKFFLTKEVIKSESREVGKFAAFFEGEMQILAFKEVDLSKLLETKTLTGLGEGWRLKSHTLTYSMAEASDPSLQRIKLNTVFTAKAEQVIDPQSVRKMLVGKNEAELQAMILAIPGLKKADISFFPIWAGSAPMAPEKIHVTVD